MLFSPGPLVERHETTQRLPHNLLSCVTVKALCFLAPDFDGAIEGNAEDPLLARFEKKLQANAPDQATRHRNLTVLQKG